jgi:hypothetical protein
VYEFRPAPNPLARAWRPGGFTFSTGLSPAEVGDRVRARTRGYDQRRPRRGREHMVSWVQADRVRVWRSTFWRSQPSRGALLFDARLEEIAGGTRLDGRLRLDVAYIATVAWTAAYLVFAFFIHLPAPLMAVLVLVSAIQLLGIALLAPHDGRPMLDFIDELLAAPGVD